MIMDWVGILITGVSLVFFALGYRFLWPLVKDTWIVKKAIELVYLMEETYGAGTGATKFETALSMLQTWLTARGWKINLTAIADAITAAVGKLHAEQGKIPDKAE
jgi:hypothetical protein